MAKEKKYKTAGILGGMGPLATLELYRMILDYTDAEGDGDHIPVVISSQPEVPDRTAAILEGGESPLPYLISRARMLQKAGVDFIGMPCVTAHYYLDKVAREIEVEFINMLEITADSINSLDKSIKNILVLSTAGTLKAGIWKDALNKISSGRFIYPDNEKQEIVNRVIYGTEGVKGGNLKRSNERLEELLRGYKNKGIDGVLAGCTELGVLMQGGMTDLKIINPLFLLAIKIIEKAGAELKKASYTDFF